MFKSLFRKPYKSVARAGHARKFRRITKHPAVTIPLATFSALLMLSVLALVVFSGGSPSLRASDTRIAVVSYDNEELTVPTRADTVGELLQRLDIELDDGDTVEPAADAPITTDNFRINVYRAMPVTIIDGDRKTFSFSAAATPRSIAEQTGIDVYPEDRLDFIPTENFLLEGSLGQRVVINRATPVNINLYGTQVVMRTHAQTVGELLDERNINLGEEDNVEPARDTPITRNMQVFLLQRGTQLATVEEEIDMPVEEVEDDSLSFGSSVVRQEGSPGKRLVTYIIEHENGEEVDRQEIQSVVVQEPVTQIVARGAAINIPSDRVGVMAAAGISPSDYHYVDYIFSYESTWNAAAVNPSYCIGLGQNCPEPFGDPNGHYWLTEACPQWEHDPVCQTERFAAYAESRYGSWAEAYNFSRANGWW